MRAEEAAHLGPAAQALFGIGQRGAAQLFDPAAKADGAEHIGEAAAAAMVHERTGRGDGGQVQPGASAVSAAKRSGSCPS